MYGYFLYILFNTLPETNTAPENQWLEDEISLLGLLIFRCYVSFRKGNHNRRNYKRW